GTGADYAAVWNLAVRGEGDTAAGSVWCDCAGGTADYSLQPGGYGADYCVSGVVVVVADADDRVSWVLNTPGAGWGGFAPSRPAPGCAGFPSFRSSSGRRQNSTSLRSGLGQLAP